MTKTKNGPNRAVRFGLSLAVCAAGTVAQAAEPQLNIQAVQSDVVVTEGVVDATFGIEVTNMGMVPAADLLVMLPDSTEIALGDVPAGGTVVSEPETHVLQTDSPSNNIPFDVTLSYVANEGAVEETGLLVLSVAEE
jgi:hypothetical protein